MFEGVSTLISPQPDCISSPVSLICGAVGTAMAPGLPDGELQRRRPEKIRRLKFNILQHVVDEVPTGLKFDAEVRDVTGLQRHHAAHGRP